jgi:FkbM family methyltransferase
MHEVMVLDAKVAELEGLDGKIVELQNLDAKVAELEGLNAKVAGLQNLNAKVRELEALSAKVRELENQQLVAISTASNIADQHAVQSRLAVFEDMLPEIREKLTRVEEALAKQNPPRPAVHVQVDSPALEPGLPAFVYCSPKSFDGLYSANGEAKVSYAQNAEDIILARLFPERNNGFYVDVGAAHPVMDSVTQYFYRLGWRGINIEPHPAFFEGLKIERQRDINLNVGLAATPSVGVFYEVTDCIGMSTFDAACADRLQNEGHPILKRYVPISTLAAVCESCVENQIDFLKIDTEGGELGVIRGANLRKFRPKVIVVEATEPGTQIPSWESWEPLLVSEGYTFAYFDGLNRWYVRDEDVQLLDCFRTPPNVFDGFVSWRSIQGAWELQQFRDKLFYLAGNGGFTGGENIEDALGQIKQRLEHVTNSETEP